MDRLLGDEEIQATLETILGAWKEDGQDCILSFSYPAISYEVFEFVKRETLKAVGEWLDNAFLFDDEGVVVELQGIIAQLLQGEMPEDAPQATE